MHSSLLLVVAALAFNVNALIIGSFSRCGAQTWNILTCKHSLFGHCCSKDGFCGNSPAHCGTGCQNKFGTCNPPAPATTRPTVPSSTAILKPSTSQATSRATSSSIVVISSSSTSSALVVSSTVIASSSSASSVIVPSSTIIATSTAVSSTITPSGPVASTSADTPTTVATSSTAAPTGQVSLDGQCGAANGGAICLTSQFGDCCSEHGWCGSSAGHCGTGCQEPFGNCASTSPVSPTPSSPSTPSTPTPICGVEGFANNNDYYASSFNLLDTTDVSLCATKCLAEPTCQSYLFNPLLGNCAYLVYSLQQGEFIATDDTDQLFWERACAE